MSYGAAGGFMAGSQDSPGGGGKSRGPQSLRPVTIYQIQNADQANPDAEFTIDGVEIKDITFVACVRNKNESTTNIAYLIEDGTGQIEARQWINAVEDGETQFGDIENNTYVRVLGTIKAFGGKRSINCNRIRRVTDMNEINFHMVEVAYVSTWYKHDGKMGAKVDMSGVAGAVGYNTDNPYAGNDDPVAAEDFSGYQPAQRAVLVWLAANREQLEPVGGAHLNTIRQNALPNKSLDDIRAIMMELDNQGAVYEGTDDHWQVTL
ncbi:hypothetical protein ACM66B_005013 [Microbotryomycetes sp. NB124-2]